MKDGATLNAARTRRFRLWRTVGPGIACKLSGRCTFVMLNPSVADEAKDDPTLKRCIRYARDWGFARLDVVNLFSLITPYPGRLRETATAGDLKKAHEVIVDKGNAQHVLDACEGAFVVCAWGANGGYIGRDATIRYMLEEHAVPLHVLGFTKHHLPKHPLRLSASLRPMPWLHERCGNPVCSP